MGSFFGMIELMMLCGTLLILALMVLVAVPNFEMREVAAAVVKSVLRAIAKSVTEAREAQNQQASSTQSSK